MALDVSKAALLLELGYAPPHAELLDQLATAGLTREGKDRISLAKREGVERELANTFIAVCGRGDCLQRATREDNRRVVQAADPSACAICGGKPSATAIAAMEAACIAAGWTRLVVVGGARATCAELRRQLSGKVDVRLVDGTASRPRKAARHDLLWADHVVIWGATPLDHKVSKLYSSDPKATSLVRRGIDGLCRHICESATLRK